MKKILLALTALAIPSMAEAQSIPGWKSYQQTGNPADIVPSAGTPNSVAQWMGKKVDVDNGTSTNQTLTTPTISNPSVSGGTSNGQTINAASLTAGDGTHNSPSVGTRLGYNQNQYDAPNPSVYNSLTVTAPSPIINLRSVFHHALTQFSIDSGGNTNIENYVSGARINLITSSSAVQIQDTASSAAIWLVSSSNIVVPITADTGGGMALGNSLTGSSLYLNFPNIRIGTSFNTTISDCGSISGSTGCIPVVNSSGTLGYVPFFPKGN